MDSKEYIQLALRTENKNHSDVADRLLENRDEVFAALNNAIIAAQQLDWVVKKKVFYGKSPKYYEAPLFKRSEDQESLIKSERFIRLLHGFMGIMTEGGEGEFLVEHISTSIDLDLVNINEENGDVDWYQALIADECGTDFEKEQLKNIKKLAHRHGEKFSDAKVVNRDLEDRERNSITLRIIRVSLLALFLFEM